MFGMQMGKLGGVGQMTLAQRIAYMFANSEPGAWYDPSDLSTLFQDSAGTTPVTAIEQPVGLMLDKSGRGNHATQATATKRPVLKIDAVGCYYLSFDGVDDALQTGSIDFTGTDKMTVWAGVTKLSDSSVSVLAEISSTGDGTGVFNMYTPATATSNLGFRSKGTTAALAAAIGYGAPITAALTGIGNISGDIASLRVNGVATTVGADQGTGNYGNYPLYIGARAGTSLFLNGRIYNLIVRGAQSSQSQIEACELYVKQKMRLP